MRDGFAALRRPERERLTDPRWDANAERLQAFRGRHAGERCVIIGNGPSLGRMDLAPLRGVVTFGLNRIYMMFDRLGFETTYHVVVNRLVIDQCAGELARLRMPQFVNWHVRDALPPAPNRYYVYDAYKRTLGFSTDASMCIWEGATVTYVAMQLAFYMGFEEVVLIGVDHNFKTKGEPHKVVESTGEDPDHFDPAYFGKGFKWQLPDLETSELSYRLADYHYRLHGRRIVDATVGGKLDVFPKADFRALFGGGGA